MKKLILPLIIVICLCFPSASVKAETLNDMKNDLANLQKKYNDNNSAKALTESQIANVKNKIQQTNQEIEQINNEIITLNNQIEESNKQIKLKEKEIKSIINYYQISNSGSVYLEYIFSATSFTDLIYRVSVAEQLSDTLKKEVNEYNKLIKENENRIKEIEQKKVSLKELEQQLKQEEAKLGKELVGITEAGVSLKDDINSLQKTINIYEKTYRCSLTEEISACTYRYFASQGTIATNVALVSGFYRPISGGYISAPFGHHDNGLDIAVAEGTPLKPAADGIVSQIWHHYSCGGNMVFIIHNVGGKQYTTAYFHLKSYNVSIGQKVSHTQIIGYTGGRSYGYDSCTTGPHLHFQLSTVWYNPLPTSTGVVGGTKTYSVFNSNSINPVGIAW